ncbi:MAG: diaminopimelate epimerase, partial [Clostridia bacterium]|nr:diaminopimelate epimerase [Clostridia bacterium]
IDYCVYTPGANRQSVTDFIALHRRAMQLRIACLTSLDTAGALCDIIRSRFTEENTELVDLNHMRTQRRRLAFAKMEGTGNDYIYCENFDGSITCPESLAISLTDRHRGVGGDGLVLMEKSDVADARMRIFNKDGSEGGMAGNSIRCVAKYLFDKGIVPRSEMTVETRSGVRRLHVRLMNGQVTSVTVDMGAASLHTADLPALIPTETAVDYPLLVDDTEYRCTCCSVGNPHCVTFCGRVDDVDLRRVGPMFEHHPLFPERVNTEFVRAVNPKTLKMRVWERGNGDTDCCGTGACAAVVAATELGLCPKGEEITVKQKGGDLRVTYTDETVLLTGEARLVFEGTVVY